MGLERCSAVKSTSCSLRGPEFESQHPCGITTIYNCNLMGSDNLFQCADRHPCRQNVHIHKINKSLRKGKTSTVLLEFE